MSAPLEIKHTALSEMEALMREKIEQGGSVTFSPKGKSMLPMLRSSGDSVTLIRPPARIKKGTVALFISKTGDEERKFVLHRLVKIKKDRLIFCGDNRRSCDEPVLYEDVIGVVSGYESRGKTYTERELWYRIYRRWMVATSSCRGAALGIQNFIYKIWKKLKG